MSKKEITKQEKNNNDMPFASIIIEEYRRINRGLFRTVKWLTLIAVILLVMLAIETTYIVIYWDSLHPYAGAINTCEK